jgi:hypothetical protein
MKKCTFHPYSATRFSIWKSLQETAEFFTEATEFTRWDTPQTFGLDKTEGKAVTLLLTS